MRIGHLATCAPHGSLAASPCFMLLVGRERERHRLDQLITKAQSCATAGGAASGDSAHLGRRLCSARRPRVRMSGGRE